MVLRRAKKPQITLGYCDPKTGQRVYPAPDNMAELLMEEDQMIHEDVGDNSDGRRLMISCLPALGKATIVERERHSVKFVVLLECNDHSLLENTTAAIWHNHNGHHEWNELALQRTNSLEDVLVIYPSEERNPTRLWFTGELHGLPKHGHAVSFTIKYRNGASGDWHWVKDSMDVEDGELLFQASADFGKHSSYDLQHFFDGMSSDIKFEPKHPDTDASKTQLWELTCAITPAKGLDSGYQHHQLGKVTHASKWFALVRLWSPWLAPRHGKSHDFKLDKDGILLSFLRTNGLCVVILGLSGVDDVVTTFVHDDSSNIIIKGRNDREHPGTSKVYVAVAESFEVANAAVLYYARRTLESVFSKDAVAQTQTSLGDDIKPEWLEEWYDGLSYCTWNGLGQKLTSTAIYRALDELAKNGIGITNLIIDDNWQSISAGELQGQRGWQEFEANAEGFPGGLKATTTEIRERHPKILHIAVWHAMYGYWGGVDPKGKIASEYKTREVKKERGYAGDTITVVDGEDASRLYDDFYRFLAKSGIDSVKTDAQCYLDMLVNAPDRRNLIQEYQDAWTIAHLRHFAGRAISCMSQIPQAIFRSQLPRNKPQCLLRNSDDFFPEVEASHAWHIFCNAHNSLLVQHLNALPDWDMFQTSHDWASFHAAARCVSGGPIYITDVPGQHDTKLINQMVAQSPKGKTVILRPSVVGKTIDAFNDYSAQVLLKIGSYNGMAHSGIGILGVFNVTKKEIFEIIPLESFPGTETGEYVVQSFVTGLVSQPISCVARDGAMIGVSLPRRNWDILTAHPAPTFDVHGQKIKVALMGIMGKMTGCAAIIGSNVEVGSNNRLRISVKLKVLGVFGVWLSDLEKRDINEELMVTIFSKPIPAHCVRRNGKLLEVDVERAWKEGKENPGWSNEVNVDIFVG